MFTFLDLLVIVSMALVTASFLSLALMFLVKNQKIRYVCFCIVVVLGLYMGYAGFRINWYGFTGQAVLAVVLALVGAGSLVLTWIRKKDEKVFLGARIAAAAALVLGVINALLV